MGEIGKILEVFRYSESPPGFILGCFARTVSIVSQQIRALNLAFALTESSLVTKDTRICVVGAGFAGLTLVAGVRRKVPASIVLLEREAHALRLQRNAHHRWLHPWALNWPVRSLEEDQAGLPVLDWKAGFASQVAEDVIRTWNSEEGVGDIAVSYSVDRIVAESVFGKWQLSWSSGTRAEAGDFDLLVWCVGFGRDKPGQEEGGGYWDHDGALFAAATSGGRHPERWIVAGAGDGGFIDTIRILRNGETLEPWAADFLRQESVREAALRIKYQEQFGTRQQVHAAYAQLRLDAAKDFLNAQDWRDADIEVISDRRYFYGPGTSHLNRMLLSQVAAQSERVRFHQDKVVSANRENGTWRLTLESGEERTPEKYISRIGPQAEVSKLPELDAASAHSMRAWKVLPQFLAAVAEPMWPREYFSAGYHPDRAPSLGRTSILSIIARLDGWKRLHKSLQDALDSLHTIRIDLKSQDLSPMPTASEFLGDREGHPARRLANVQALWFEASRSLRDAVAMVGELAHSESEFASYGIELQESRRSLDRQLLEGAMDGKLGERISSLWGSVLFLLGVADRSILRLTDRAKAVLEEVG